MSVSESKTTMFYAYVMTYNSVLKKFDYYLIVFNVLLLCPRVTIIYQNVPTILSYVVYVGSVKHRFVVCAGRQWCLVQVKSK